MALSTNTNWAIAIGNYALRSSTTGCWNTAVGHAALYSNTSGCGNVAIGYGALYGNSYGYNNIGIGCYAGCSITTGCNNTVIGNLIAAAGCICTVLIGAGTCERIRVNDTGLYINNTLVAGTTGAGSGTLQQTTDAGFTTTNRVNITNTTSATSTATGALTVAGGIGVGLSVYVGNRIGFVNTSSVSVVYQVYNAVTNSLDTVFG